MAQSQAVDTRDLPMVKLFVCRMGEVRDFLDQAGLYRETLRWVAIPEDSQVNA